MPSVPLPSKTWVYRSLQLTRRQIEVLGMVVRGHGNRAIAANMNICESTVKVHLRDILRRLGVHNRTQVAMIAAHAVGTGSA